MGGLNIYIYIYIYIYTYTYIHIYIYIVYIGKSHLKWMIWGNPHVLETPIHGGRYTMISQPCGLVFPDGRRTLSLPEAQLTNLRYPAASKQLWLYIDHT